MSFVIFDRNEAPAIRRNDDAADSTLLRGLEGRPLQSAVAGDAHHRAIGQANGEAGAIGQ